MNFKYEKFQRNRPLSQYTESSDTAVVPENRLAGTVGALLFSLAGGVVYFLLYQVGYIAAISGLIGVICAFKGYEVFAKKLSKFGCIISVVMALLVIILAWYCCLAKDVYSAYQSWLRRRDRFYAHLCRVIEKCLTLEAFNITYYEYEKPKRSSKFYFLVSAFVFCQRTVLETVLITFSLFCSLFFKFCC